MVRKIDNAKFKRLAEKRVTKALNIIKLIGNLSNKSNYSYKKSDVDKIHKVLQQALDNMKARFDNGDETEKFKL